MKPVIPSSHMKMLTGIRYKHKNPKLSGRKKILSEGFNSYSFSYDIGKLVNRQRLIDRQNDKYIEIVIDEDTAQVLHYCNERLSEHRDHGSAKSKKQHNKRLKLDARKARAS